MVQPPVSQEKAIQVMTKASRNSCRHNNHSASARDYHHSRNQDVPERHAPPSVAPHPTKKARKMRGSRRNRVTPQKKRAGRTTRASRKRKPEFSETRKPKKKRHQRNHDLTQCDSQ